MAPAGKQGCGRAGWFVLLCGWVRQQPTYVSVRASGPDRRNHSSSPVHDPLPTRTGSGGACSFSPVVGPSSAPSHLPRFSTLVCLCLTPPAGRARPRQACGHVANQDCLPLLPAGEAQGSVLGKGARRAMTVCDVRGGVCHVGIQRLSHRVARCQARRCAAGTHADTASIMINPTPHGWICALQLNEDGSARLNKDALLVCLRTGNVYGSMCAHMNGVLGRIATGSAKACIVICPTGGLYSTAGNVSSMCPTCCVPV